MTWDPSNPLLAAVLEAAMAFHVAGDDALRADAPGFGSERPADPTARLQAGARLRLAADAWGAEERRRRTLPALVGEAHGPYACSAEEHACPGVAPTCPCDDAAIAALAREVQMARKARR